MTVQSRTKNISTKKYFPIDSNAFSCLHEALYYVVSRFDNNNFVFVVKLNDRCTHCTIQIKIRLCTFHIPQFKLLQIFEKVIFPLTSMVTLPKIVKKYCIFLNVCSFKMHVSNLMKLKRIFPYSFNFQMTPKA